MRKAQSYNPERPLPSRAAPVDVQRDLELDDDPQVGAPPGGEIPVWQRDSISLSARARRLIERLKPALIRVLSFWDHRVTRVSIDERTLVVDTSGSYRVE